MICFRFNRTAGNIAAYPTYVSNPRYRRKPISLTRIYSFSLWNGTTYRPTNEGCLMRQVVLPHFCKPCSEGLWLALLKRVNLIDNVTVTWDASDENASIRLTPLGLGQFRGNFSLHDESLEILWARNGSIITEETNTTHFSLPRAKVVGNWTVAVILHTDEVRMDPENYLTSTKMFQV
jgi:hypothetical protein